MDKLIYGGDTETVKGKPNSLQFYSEDTACDEIIFCDEKTACKKFLQWCSKRSANCQHVIYVHNLAFDLIEFLWGYHAKLIQDGTEFDFKISGWHITGFYGTPTFCRLSDSAHRSIVLVDSFSFYRGSLASAAALYCPDLPKLKAPKNLGSVRYTSKNTGFCEYAMRDAQVTYHIGKAIQELHNEFDLTQCISVADLAARIFRHRFLSYTIPQPNPAIVAAALDSYHGGKNNITNEPGWYTHVTGIDISSAYPDAMHDLPAFSDARLYKRYTRIRAKIHARRVCRVPDMGVYRISGKVASCKWPCLFSHAFAPLQGQIHDVWVQGYELNEALESGEFHVQKIAGYFYDSERDNQAPALRAFTEDFYRRKQNETDKVRRYGYKLILNSISGKFVQTRKRSHVQHYDIATEKLSDAHELVAGGMFHSFIASAITAHTRARIHRIEHHYKALHTATDGIFTQRRTDKTGAFRVVENADRLGQLTAEARGDLLMIRNKCYILYGKTGMPSAAFRGKQISKYALHGFQGKVTELEKLIASGRRSYTITRPNKLRESIKRGLTPNEFLERKFSLKVGPLKVHTDALQE